MNTLILYLLASNFLVGFCAFIFFLQQNGIKKKLYGQKQDLSRKLYEISILNKIQQELGYPLNTTEVVESMVLSLEDLFSMSAVSYAIIFEDRIELKTYIREPVGQEFVKKVKEIILDSVCGIDGKDKNKLMVNQDISGMVSNKETFLPQSYFNIPLFTGERFLAIINIASKDKNVYKEEDMSMFYKIIDRAGNAINRFESIIKTEKSKLDSMLTSIPIGAVMLLFENGSLKFSYMNTAARNFLKLKDGITTIHVIASFGKSFDLIKEVKHILKNKKSVVFNNIEIQEKFYKIVLSPMFLFESKNVIGISIAMEDITLEKQIENMRDNFTNMVVHELRAPLVSIKGAVTLLSKSTLGKEDADKMFEILKESANTMLEEVGQLLDAAKIDAGRFIIIKDLADINEVVKERVETFTFLAKERKISVEMVLGDGIPQFEFDKVRTGQVLNNLLSNSLKFTNNGGKIEVETRKNGGSITVTIKDNGIGIPQDEQASLFSKYAQASGIFRKDSTGLGLYISKGIIKSHGGKIWLESSQGKGTTVSFTIPIMNAAYLEKEKHHKIIAATNAVVN
ncbi:MAG: hypothetical protein A2857_01715 [Candidatus Levybacteria bacterium RIFCSPHIGHO2_01_FULL_36_15]|nr:MAG: hypothetical protein A2857_01715 [Candidatus Levybacteria bacterium RIFCSPHIGHO2_01_FULL_36_15]OGH38012.1 MAG: hypothetical protein A2905_05875 [Candidatus Levybacteria bacterium RIFCSPLOWO2_01_FULL_36_10]